jgi:hypothetical protein
VCLLEIHPKSSKRIKFDLNSTVNARRNSRFSTTGSANSEVAVVRQFGASSATTCSVDRKPKPSRANRHLGQIWLYRVKFEFVLLNCVLLYYILVRESAPNIRGVRGSDERVELRSRCYARILGQPEVEFGQIRCLPVANDVCEFSIDSDL